MAEENEIQIVLTAIDNASEAIEKVNSALGGDTGKFPGGQADYYPNASKEIDALVIAANKAKEPIEKVAKETDSLGIAIKAVGVVSPQTAAQLNRLRGISAGVGETLGKSAISISAAATAAGILAGALALVATAYYGIKQIAATRADVLENPLKFTEKDVQLVKDFDDALRGVAESGEVFKNIWGGFWDKWSLDMMQVAINYAEFAKMFGLDLGKGFNFPELDKDLAKRN